MSALSGICHWDGRAIDASQLRVMAAHCKPAGPDGGGVVAPMDGIAMQAHVLHFDRTSAAERQPYRFGPGSVLTWDGRLDNRDDLLVLLDHDLKDDVTDAALVAAAYNRWGVDCAQRLIGDWSFAIWDGAERRLVLARDYMGNRPLYYLEIPSGLAWSTSLDALADTYDRYSQPNDAYIAGKLTFGVRPEMTPFKGIFALRAAHLLVTTRTSGLTIRRYWTYEATRIRFRHTFEYAEQMRTLLIDAVRVRLRSNRRVWAHLSGGWDSSSIVCIANALIRRRQVETPAVQPVSGVTSGSPESDETPFIEAVERWCGLTSVRRESVSRLPVFDELLGSRRPYPHDMAKSLEAEVHTSGDRIVLSGELGDAVMIRGSRSLVSLLEALHEGHPIRFIKLCLARAEKRQRSLPAVFKHLILTGYFSRYQTSQVKRRLKTKLPDIAAHDQAAQFGLTRECFALASAERPEYPSALEFPIVKRGMVETFYSVADSGALSNSDLAPGILRTYPYSHRPLVTFMLGVPQLAFWDPEFSRAGMRRAMTGILAPDILTRSSKCRPEPALHRWQREWRETFNPAALGAINQWRIVGHNYVLSSSIERAIAELALGKGPSHFLVTSLYLEAWLRSLDLAGSSASHDVRENRLVDMAGFPINSPAPS
jgi:asparagine synthase (glutamine-hydrolysing)